MKQWNADLIEKIYKQKQIERSEDRDNLLRLTSKNLYGEKIHYALELIQNAEDENSSSITFIFDKDYIAIINDGRPFNKEDVWGICSVKPGRKKNKIGFFGIGFKSVFNITKKPQVISGEFNFEIENFIYPRIKTTIPKELQRYFSKNKGAIFILPYSPDLARPHELIENFNTIDNKILLFLENIKELKFIDNINNKSWLIKKESKDPYTTSIIDTRSNQKTDWLVYHRDLKVLKESIVPKEKKGIKETRITIAIPLDASLRETIRKEGVIYCYLPTKQRADLPFLLQADFIPTAGRGSISEDQWNKWLMKELGYFTADILDEKKNSVLRNCLYELIPTSEEIQDDIVKSFYISLTTTLKTKKIALSKRGWRLPGTCVLPNEEKIRDFLSEKDLKIIFKKSVTYFSTKNIRGNQLERAYMVLKELGSIELGADKIIKFLKNKSVLKKKKKEWFLNLYDYLATVFRDEILIWDEEKKHLYEELRKISFILTDENKLVSLKDHEKPDRLICYPQKINLSEIHKVFTEGEVVFLDTYFQESGIMRRKQKDPDREEKRKRVKEWFDKFGVKKYFKEIHIIKEVILPKYSSGKYQQYTDIQLFRFIDFMRKHWNKVESEINNKKLSPDFVKQVKDTIKLKAFQSKGKKKNYSYKKPTEIYFSKAYGKREVMQELFKGIKDIWFLSPYYLNTSKRERRKKGGVREKSEYTWKKFFEELGVWSSPRVEKLNEWNQISNNNEYPWIKFEYSPYDIHEIRGDATSEDINKLIEFCSKRKNQRENRKRMIMLWESLEKNWKLYKELGIDNVKYRFSHIQRLGKYHYTQRTFNTTSFLELLRNAEWVLGSGGGFFKPTEVFHLTPENIHLLGEEAKFVELKANPEFLKDIGVKTEPTIDAVLDHLKKYRQTTQIPKTNKIEKMKIIYSYIDKKIAQLESKDEREAIIKKIKRFFKKYELLYLPREDKAWWRPEHVFWKDHSSSFGILRGYIEDKVPLYDLSLKSFFSLIGVKERAKLNECIGLLEEIKNSGRLEEFKHLIPKIYFYMNEIIKLNLDEEISCDKEIFLSEDSKFCSPAQLFYNDDNEIKNFFVGKIDILWLPFQWAKIKDMIKVFGFKSLRKNTKIKKYFKDLRELEGDLNNQLIQKLLYGINFLYQKHPELYDLLSGDIYEKVKELQTFETEDIQVNLTINSSKSNYSVRNISKDSFYSIDENRLYIKTHIELFSSIVAKEISKIFSPWEEVILPFLDSIFGAKTEDEIKEKIEIFGLDKLTKPPNFRKESIKIISKKDEKNIVPLKKETKKKSQLKHTHQPQLPQFPIKSPTHKFINPDQFTFFKIEDYIPYESTDGKEQLTPKSVSLRPGKSSHRPILIKPKRVIKRIDAEEIALELVMRFEEQNDRIPEDRHKQPGIGYDIYSTSERGEKRFIEVKHFSGGAGVWELTSHQWEKAKREKENYFVYIVSGIMEGNTPVIEIIKDPVKYLTPDPPRRKLFSEWKNGVIQKVYLGRQKSIRSN